MTEQNASLERHYLVALVALTFLLIAATPCYPADLYITEFMAVNGTTLADEDGDFSDWIEIFNASGAPVNIEGWFLTDNLLAPATWMFPAVTLEPGAYLVVFASDKNRIDPGSELHTNFKLDGTGDYLAFVRPDGLTIEHEYSPVFPEQREDITYGLVFDATPLIERGAAVDILIPADGSLGATWIEESFTPDGSWTSGITGVGFNITDVKIAGELVVDLDAQGLLAGPLATWSNSGAAGDFSSVAGAPTVDSVGGVTSVTFDGDDSMRSADLTTASVTGGDDWSIETWVYNPTIIDEECLVNWGRRDGPAGTCAQQNYGTSGSYGSVTHWTDGPDMGFDGGVPAAGQWHHLAITYEGGSGGMERVYVDGVLNAFESKTVNIHGPADGQAMAILLGAASGDYGYTPVPNVKWFSGSLARVRLHTGFLTAQEVENNFNTEAEYYGLVAGESSSLVGADVEADMLGVNSSAYMRIPFDVTDPSLFDTLTLEMKYDDGFIAYINGVEVARRNSPESPAWNSAATAERIIEDVVVAESISLTAQIGLLKPGANLLAIHGLNYDVNDDDFLILPELVAVSLGEEDPRYFETPTPGGINGEWFFGFVADTRFSADRGFYTAPVDVGITTLTAGAVIRYTTDGTPPRATSGMVYSATLTIDRTTVLRAAAFKDGYCPTNVDTHTYFFVDDIIMQSHDGSPPTPDWPAGYVNGQVFNYGMDPDVINDIRYTALVDDALLAIPSVSLVTALGNLVDPATGIYVNAFQRGDAWERPVSVELINPDDSGGFQIDAGMRIRGTSSRDDNNPKHGLRLFFRAAYGAPKLEYPLFGDEGADRFDNVDLRCEQNYSWSYARDGNSNAMVREVFARDLQREQGEPYTRSRYYHLYINGVYWGIYQTQERAEASFAETYLGGDADDHDVVKTNHLWPRENEATDGTLEAYTRLFEACLAGFVSDASYYAVQGLTPDGVPNPAYERLVDVDNVIDYMLTVFITGDKDAPITAFGGDAWANNYYGIYNRNNPDGFKFFRHDAEHSLDKGLPDRTGPYLHPNFDASVTYFNPQTLHQKLAAHVDYRMRFADRTHKFFFHDGPMTPANLSALILSRASELDLAIIGESVRWGDSKIHPARTKDDDWIPLINSINALLLGRTPIVLNQLKARGWYPNVDAPDFSINGTPQHGGEISSGAELTISAPVGTIYYTLDGTDPRSPGGAIAGGAGVYDGAIALTDTTFVKARVLEGPEWSAVCEAMFQVMESSPEDIIITELLPNANGEDDYKEWFEIYNTIGWPIDINGWVISDNGTDSHTINNGAPLIVPAKGYLILGESTDPGLNGGAPVDYAYGPDDVTLGNGGDEIILSQGGTVIHAVGYEAFDNAPISVLDTGLDANPGLAIGMARDYCNGAEPLWQVQISHYGSNGDTGTPGANNDGVEVCAPPEPTPEPTPEITTSAEMWDFYY